ncbi:hypothetical protein LDENG_00246950 [Lucifuga dentata]|nr:hypothetical protein LDENG_00246950 [Lucifuga dentata]
MLAGNVLIFKVDVSPEHLILKDMGNFQNTSEYIRGTAHVRCFGDKVREARLRWFGHVQRRDSEHIGRRMLRLELPGRRPRGRPKRRFMDVVKEDMKG